MAFRILQFLKNFELKYLHSRLLMTSDCNMKQVEEELKKNPYFGKYQEKIEKLRKEKPVQYNSRLKAKVEQKQKNKKSIEKIEVKYPEPKIDMKDKGTKKCLNDILKLEMIDNKTADEIRTLWIDYHKGKDMIFSIYTGNQYDKLSKMYTQYPTFVLPLPRGDGYEFFLMQFCDHQLHFTPMVQFKKHGENSPECLTVTYFPDLKDRKDIVLMRGKFDKDVVSSLESQCLLNVVQMFYNGESPTRSDMIKIFNKKPDDFKYVDIISELERIGFNG